jgi:hypothetical protein
MSILKVYINPFDDFGNYTGFIDITTDINFNSISKLSQKLDNNSFDVGVLRFGDISLSARNDHGRFSDVGSSASIFKYKRSGSLVRITWLDTNNPFICGFSVCGLDKLQSEITLFEGILNDESTTSDAESQETTFQVLAYESILDKMIVPYASISNGDLISQVIYVLLNQPYLTDLVSVDVGNISCSVDVTIDDKTNLENKTVKEGLDLLLEISNSILYIDNANVLYVMPRNPTSEVQANFYGPSSVDGIQNIVKLSALRSGLNKMFNYWTWKDVTNLSEDSTSTLKYGARKKEIGDTIITDGTKVDSILDASLAEFKNPKQEFDLTVIMDDSSVGLFILDKITIDYPTIYSSARDQTISVYGLSVYGYSYYPLTKSGIIISPLVDYKIMGRSIDLKAQLITLSIREV